MDRIDSKLINEMVAFYNKRTKKHISLVNKYANKINKCYPNHDLDKLNDNEITPWYVFLTWKYVNPDFEYPFDISYIDEATFKHIKNNNHHPEYWDNSIKLFKRDSEGLDNRLTNATKMSTDSIYEMCADWCAMSEELNNTPEEWANKMVNKRWKFTDEQVNEIYKTLKLMWE